MIELQREIVPSNLDEQLMAALPGEKTWLSAYLLLVSAT